MVFRAAQLQYILAEFSDLIWIEASSRFVHDENGWIVQESLSQADALTQTTG